MRTPNGPCASSHCNQAFKHVPCLEHAVAADHPFFEQQSVSLGGEGATGGGGGRALNSDAADANLIAAVTYTDPTLWHQPGIRRAIRSGAVPTCRKWSKSLGRRSRSRASRAMPAPNACHSASSRSMPASCPAPLLATPADLLSGSACRQQNTCSLQYLLLYSSASWINASSAAHRRGERWPASILRTANWDFGYVGVQADMTLLTADPSETAHLRGLRCTAPPSMTPRTTAAQTASRRHPV